MSLVVASVQDVEFVESLRGAYRRVDEAQRDYAMALSALGEISALQGIRNPRPGNVLSAAEAISLAANLVAVQAERLGAAWGDFKRLRPHSVDGAMARVRVAAKEQDWRSLEALGAAQRETIDKLESALIRADQIQLGLRA